MGRQNPTFWASRALVCAGLLAIPACGSSITSTHFPVKEESQKSLAEKQSLEIVRIDVGNIKTVMDEVQASAPLVRKAISIPPKSDYVYRVGPGDVLQVSLWDNPERVSTATTEAPNLIVSEDGMIFYPFVGEIKAAGKSAAEIRRELMTALQAYLQEPQVEVSVVGFNAHSATLLGVVGAPGKYTLTNVPMTLLDAINKAGPLERSDLTRVTIRRKGRDYVVDLSAFIEKGDQRHNPVLVSGDIVVVDPPANGEVYTFGEVEVGELTLGVEDTSLISVLAQRGGLKKLRANASGVFVFRARKPVSAAPAAGDPAITVYQFELNEPAMYVLAQSFQMRGGDVIFVTQDPISRWNDTVTKLLSPVISTLQVQAVVNAIEDE